ncbi:MAG: hypothetical protein U5K37_12450 [Natrialbaceae archaeon]|nr:hypothetical protein [Natrialbaceae archaeon]
MELRDLAVQNWRQWEQDRFLKSNTKTKTDNFDPESFQHDGFDDRDRYVEQYVPGLAHNERIRTELENFKPPKVSDINASPYQAFVIRYGILRTLIEQPKYIMEKDSLLKSVQTWQTRIIETNAGVEYDDDLAKLARAAVEHNADVDDSELNLIGSYCHLHNQDQEFKHLDYTWQDLFDRLAAIDRFPKVSRSDSPEHALETIKQGLWSLQMQALVYEISDDDLGQIVGIPEDYEGCVREWLHYEMGPAEYRQMLEH